MLQGTTTHGLMRAAFGALFWMHGAQKLLGWFTENPSRFESGGEGFFHYQLIAAGFIEFIGGLLIMVGLKTRMVATVTALMMLVAYVQVHLGLFGGEFNLNPVGRPPAGNGGEAALLFFFAFAFLATNGGGGMSLDRRMNGSE